LIILNPLIIVTLNKQDLNFSEEIFLISEHKKALLDMEGCTRQLFVLIQLSIYETTVLAAIYFSHHGYAT
jgi:hypothetical protein